MSDQAQNDWDVVEETLQNFLAPGPPLEAIAAFDRLREFTQIMISGLNERIASLEAELDERNELVVAKKEWPRPANLPRS